MNNIRKWCRWIHRDLSFLFSGMLLVYAISGIALNHKATYNSQFDIRVEQYKVGVPMPSAEGISRDFITSNLLPPIGEEGNYTKHYFPKPNTLKVFLKSGSNLVVSLPDGNAVYESVKPKPFMGALSRLHYNPSQAWTMFSDIFAIALIVVVLTGLIMLRGRHSLWGIGGIELAIGIAIPLIFALL